MTIPKHNEQPLMGLLTAQDVIAAHRTAEQYLRRFFFVALRVNDVQYATAENLVELARQSKPFNVFTQSLKLIFEKTDKHRLDGLSFLSTYPDLVQLLEVFDGYATPVRYRLAQGNDELNRAEAYKTAYHIAKSLVTEIERALQAEFGHSAFDAPKSWGARTVVSSETIEQIITRLNLHYIVGTTCDLAAVKTKLAATKYAI
jgi:hypothetical protein